MGKAIKVLAVASVGGHWEQLMLLRPAFSDFETLFCTNDGELALRERIERAVVLPDTNRTRPLSALRCLASALALIARYRPDVIVSTGAAPGLICLAVGRLFGARTLWIDSVANVERLSASGRMARRFSTRVFTQWAHLAEDGRTYYAGSIL